MIDGLKKRMNHKKSAPNIFDDKVNSTRFKQDGRYATPSFENSKIINKSGNLIIDPISGESIDQYILENGSKLSQKVAY